jgi:serine/threonine-protein kinase
MLSVDPKDWPAISALLDEALTLPREARAAWLDALPPAAAPHRDNLRRLLDADDTVANQRLEHPPQLDIEADSTAQPLKPGLRVGPYVLRTQIGRGGMGTVWLADRADGTMRRTVALKLPHMGWAPAFVERLARERDILASLEHPKIARLYDAGVDELGRPFLALEFVEGVPIDRYCADHHLGVRPRLDLILQIAAAVSHAHTRLVIHRDLKPSNILVTADGEVRLLDFGVAKLLQEGEAADATELTQLHGRALTLAYASPEQLRGDRVGTESDVYSLGVVAYELLAGARPYRIASNDAAEWSKALEETPVPLASQRATDPSRARELAGDLDAILNQALKVDAAERYPTVAAFAQDIQRYLDDVPVQARADTAVYRLRKFVARNVLYVGAGSLVVAALIVGTGVALWQAREARQEAARADEVKRFALSIFENADTEAGAGGTTTAVDLLAQAQKRVDSELGDRPAIAVELLTSIAYSQIGQGSIDDAARVAARAGALGRKALGPDHPLTLAAAVVEARALSYLGRANDALKLATDTIERARRTGDARDVSFALQTVSMAQIDLGDADASVAAAREAVDVIKRNPASFSPLEKGTAWLTLANTLRSTGRPGLVEAAQNGAAFMSEAYGGRTALPVLHARVLAAQGFIEEAGEVRRGLDELTRAFDEIETLLGASHPRLAPYAKFLGDGRFDAGEYAGAADAYGIALRIASEGKVGGASGLADIHLALADTLAAQGRYDEALAHGDAARDALAGSPEADASYLREIEASRALSLIRLGRVDEADRLLTPLLVQSVAGSRDHMLIQERLASVRSLQGRHEEAIALARASQAEDARDRNKRNRAEVMRVLGSTLLAAGQPKEAIAPLQQALALYRQAQIVATPEQAEVERLIAQATRA